MDSQIHSFGRTFDPATYRRGFGILGVWIQALNAVRLWCARRIALHALALDLRSEGIPVADRKAILRAAKADPSLRPELYRPRSAMAPAPLPRERFPFPFANRMDLTESRYKEGRTNVDSPERPIPISEGKVASVFALYQRQHDRSLRYYHGRQYMVNEQEEPNAREATPAPAGDDGRDPAPAVRSSRSAYHAQRARGPKSAAS